VKLLSDDKLVNAFLQGTEDAGNTLCKRYTLELRRFFTRRTENLQDAEDLAQETLGEAMANLSKLRDPRRFRGWLYKIAHGHLSRYYRAGNESGIHISIAEIPDDDGAGQANSVLAVPEHEWPDNRVIDAERLSLVRGLVEQLPHSEREVLLLKWRDPDMPLQEIFKR